MRRVDTAINVSISRVRTATKVRATTTLARVRAMKTGTDCTATSTAILLCAVITEHARVVDVCAILIGTALTASTSVMIQSVGHTGTAHPMVNRATVTMAGTATSVTSTARAGVTDLATTTTSANVNEIIMVNIAIFIVLIAPIRAVFPDLVTHPLVPASAGTAITDLLARFNVPRLLVILMVHVVLMVLAYVKMVILEIIVNTWKIRRVKVADPIILHQGRATSYC